MTNLSRTCLYNESYCHFIDNQGNCLLENEVLDLIVKFVLPTYYEWICIVLYVIVFFVGTIGNLLVIIVIQRNRSMRWKENDQLIVILLIFSYPFVFVFFKDSYKYVYNESRSSRFISTDFLLTGYCRSRCDEDLVFWFNSL